MTNYEKAQEAESNKIKNYAVIITNTEHGIDFHQIRTKKLTMEKIIKFLNKETALLYNPDEDFIDFYEIDPECWIDI